MDTIPGRQGQRRYTVAFKRRLVDETLSGAKSVAMVAPRFDLNTYLLFNWRRR